MVAAAAQQQQQQQQSQQQQQQTALSAMGNVQVTNAINQQATLGNITTVNVRNAGIPVLVSYISSTIKDTGICYLKIFPGKITGNATRSNTLN